MADPGITDLMLRLAKLLPALAATNLPESPERYIAELQLCFVRIYKAAQSRQPQAGRRSDRVLTEYLDDQFQVFQSGLLRILLQPQTPTVKAAALNALMEGVRRAGPFDSDLFHSLLRTILTTQHGGGELIGMLLGKYIRFADIRYDTLRGIPRIVDEFRSGPSADGTQLQLSEAAATTGNQAGDSGTATEDLAGDAGGSSGGEGTGSAKDDLARTLCDLLMRVPPEPPVEGEAEAWCAEDQAGSERTPKRRRTDAPRGEQEQQEEQQQRQAPWTSTKSQRAAFGRAWLALLSMLPLPEGVYGRVLLRLPDRVIPHMTNPVFLADFLTHALDKGGLTGLLALNGIFVLVTAHGYEYPGLYPALYRLLTPAALASRHCPRFFRLADALLASTAVPAYTCAAFVKRLGRLALTAPPAGAVVALAFIHNIVRRQPACAKLLGAPSRPGTAQGESPSDEWQDPYEPEAVDPNDSRALDSILWEVSSLRQHFWPQVAASVSLLDKDLTDRRKGAEVPVDDLIGSSYAKLISAELDRRLKTAPVAMTARAALFELPADAAAFPGWELA